MFVSSLAPQSVATTITKSDKTEELFFDDLPTLTHPAGIEAERNHHRGQVYQDHDHNHLDRACRRKMAAKSIFHWLSKDPAWKECTLQVLEGKPNGVSGGDGGENTSSNSPANNATRSKDDILSWSQLPPSRSTTITTLSHPRGQAYHSFFKGSLPSFKRFLNYILENPEAQHQVPLEFQQALDRLAEAGFADAHWIQSMRVSRSHFQKVSEAIAKRKRALATQHHRQHDLQTQLARLQEELDGLKHESKEPMENEAETETTKMASSSFPDHKKESTSSMAQAAIQNIFQQPTPKEDDQEVVVHPIVNPELIKVRTKIERLEKKISRKKNRLQWYDIKVARNQEQINGLKRNMQTCQPRLSKEEIDAANQVVSQVMPVICKVFAGHIEARHSKILKQYKALHAQTDLTRPQEWYLYSRLDRRKIIFHGGPTNSGKTYEALKRLKQAKRGLYLGPLRLLAAEVYETLTAAGVYCNLYTGQERREIPFATHISATVEMACIKEEYDVIVIDEIQMISDEERGSAWTQALLGSRCKEIHICGGLEAKNIVERLAAVCGDELEVFTYDRFTPLKVAKRSLASNSEETDSYRRVQPGDCVVAFSRDDIFAIKREIEMNTNYKCGIIYGSLPPQTRSEQARRFNDPNSGYDILVASDAIGMGLNLNIRRIILNSIYKNIGNHIVRLDHSAVKQISGRAGRRNSPFPHGEVTCRDPRDMAYLRKCMQDEISPVTEAGLMPTGSHIERFSLALNAYGLIDQEKGELHSTLLKFNDMATLKSDFFFCRQTTMQIIAEKIAHLDLPLTDKYNLCMAPISLNTSSSIAVVLRFAEKLASGEAPGLKQNMRPNKPKSFDDLATLCSLYHEIELFLWLQNKFPPCNMVEQQAALLIKERTTEMINECLTNTEKLELNHCYHSRDRRLRQIWAAKQQGVYEETENVEDYSQYF